jgi:hypothetical protein
LESGFSSDLALTVSREIEGFLMSSTIETFGLTSLTEIGTNFYLYDSNGVGPSLKYQGANFVAGQFGGWTPIGAERTTAGYVVAWKVTGADQYAVWSTDSNGNFASIIIDTVSGTDPTLESIETSFHQDLNGDGVIGPPTTPPTPPSSRTLVEGFGATSLTEVGTTFYLYDSSGLGPSLKYQGADYVAGQFGQVAPIGAEQTASGYEVAWKVPGADQYSVWLTDSNGNYVSIALNSVSGSSAALQSIETSFHQDLNGDGVVGSAGGGSSSPRFVYEGVDSSGAQIYDVTWDVLGSHPFAVRVLTPDHPSSNFQHSFLYALPVEGGLAQSTWGSGLNELQKLDVQDQYNATIIEPIFPIPPGTRTMLLIRP